MCYFLATLGTTLEHQHHLDTHLVPAGSLGTLSTDLCLKIRFVIIDSYVELTV